jgi:ribosome-binding protein aMBF1 (putative translation factor)
MNQKTGRSANRRNSSDPSPSPGRSRQSRGVTEGGRVYGRLVADKRARLGLTQKELAARMRTNPETVARIEEGHPPSTDLGRRLGMALNTRRRQGRLRRLKSYLRSAPRNDDALY